MNQHWKQNNQQKHQFKTVYCGDCKQRKSCGKLSQSFCCPCQLQMEQKRAERYSDYQQVYQREQQTNKLRVQQYQILKNYQGCKKCDSKEVDAYDLYEKSQLVCQPCLMRKEGNSSSPISFLEQAKWYKKCWKIDLNEWLEKYGCLPVNYKCADKWLKDKGHLKDCACLESETKETYLLFTTSLKKSKEKLKDCQCEESEKVRVSGDEYAWCEICETGIPAASKKRVIKNRNDPRFWGLTIQEKVLCSKCLESKKENMPPLRRAKFNEYQKLGRL